MRHPQTQMAVITRTGSGGHFKFRQQEYLQRGESHGFNRSKTGSEEPRGKGGTACGQDCETDNGGTQIKESVHLLAVPSCGRHQGGKG